MNTINTNTGAGTDSQFGRVVRAPQVVGAEIADNGLIHMGGFCALLPPPIAKMMGCP